MLRVTSAVDGIKLMVGIRLGSVMDARRITTIKPLGSMLMAASIVNANSSVSPNTDS